MKFLSDILARAGLVVEGVVTLNNVANATIDTDKFLTVDSGVVKYRTGSQLLSDIGGQPLLTNPVTGTGTSGQVAYFNGTSSLTSSATFAFTPTSQLLVNNSVTAASAIARGTNLTPTLVASANSDILVGLDVTPTYTLGSFTGVLKYGLRVEGIYIGQGNNTTASNQNIAIGQNTSNSIAPLQSLTTGTSNIAIGSYAGGENATGSNNVNVGVGAGAQRQGANPRSGSNNVVIGNAANLYYSVNNTVVIGNSAGNANSSDGAIIIGASASGGGGNQGSPNVVVIGTSASAIGTGGNQIVIGASAAGLGSNTIAIGNSSTSFGRWWGRLLLGTSTDSGYQLDVNGTARVQGVITGSVNGGSLILGTASSNSPAITITGYYVGNGAINITTTNPRSFNSVIGGQNNGIVLSYNSVAQGQTTFNAYFVASGNINLTDGAIDLNGFHFGPTIVSATGATIKAFSSGLSAATNRWNLYMSGSASNYLEGDTAIGTTTLGTATKFTLGGSETASSAIARGGLINTTLVAAANNDVLVGLDINPTFTNGAFTGVSNFGLRVNGRIVNTLGNNQVIFSSVSATTGWQVLTLQNTGANCTFGIEQSTGTALFGNSLAYATVLGTSNATALQFGTNALTRQTIFSNGNIGINTTTDAGFRLDVNGTARVQGAITGTAGMTLAGLLNNSSNEGRFLYLATGGASANTTYGITAGGGKGIYLNSGGNTQIDFLNGSANTFTLRTNTTSLNTFGGMVFGNVTTDRSFLTMDLISNTALFADNLAILATSAPMQASALVAMNSTTKGFLPPRMTAAQRAAITSPATGLIVYQTDGVEGVWAYTSSGWKALAIV